MFLQQPLSQRIAQSAFSLASLPDPAIACIFQHLHSYPEAGAKLAVTCYACATEFAVWRASFVIRRSRELHPMYCFSSTDSIPYLHFSWKPGMLKQNLHPVK